ncbi:hypothetical protein Q3C19_08905 [Bacteroides sp. ET489]|uniref:hypothetical protein n=1 Tax=Bacteroides sp. ET489 TaxID=3057126 RepID=UPI0026714A98|nr:hypothetical protein [Bacteroides sp. ET489]MDO3390594.1 hypothetical protein [Bacteroides sp. ET489]
MNVKTISAVMVVSFIVCAVTVSGLGLLFWLSLTVFSWPCLYTGRHKDTLSAELDKIFGSDEELR